MARQVKKLFEPWAPPVAEPEHVGAIKALAAGTALPHQQQLALHFILVEVCGIDDEPFCPGEDGRRSTDYALGKRRVGLYLRSLIAADMKRFLEPGSREQG